MFSYSTKSVVNRQRLPAQARRDDHHSFIRQIMCKTGAEQALADVPDIILCDIMMPEMDGYGVLYLLSKRPETIAVPFIFLTAEAEHFDRRKGMEMGADDYLTKPFDDMELLAAIETRLKKKEGRQAFYSKPLDRLNTLVAKKDGLAALKKIIEERKARPFKKDR